MEGGSILTKEQSYLIQLKQSVENDMQTLIERWSRIDRKLKDAWLSAANSLKQREQELSEAKSSYLNAFKSYEQVHGVPPSVVSDRRHIGYKVLVVLLFIAQFPVNAIVLRLFGENEGSTAIASAALAISLLASAHCLGRLLQKKTMWPKMKIIGIVVVIAVPALVVAGVAYLRDQYLKSGGAEISDLSPTVTWVAFVGFNILVFLVSSVASSRVHHKDLMTVYGAEKKMRRAQRAFVQAQKLVAAAKTNREKENEAACNRARLIKSRVECLTNTSRTEKPEDKSASASRGNTDPSALSETIKVTIPEILTKVEW
jgi:hypothetical protein